MKPKDLVKMLENKLGFRKATTRSDDHTYLQLTIAGHVIVTKVSHSNSEIRSSLEGKIARQLRVRGPFFRQVFACTKSSAEYQDQVRSDPFPPFSVRL